MAVPFTVTSTDHLLYLKIRLRRDIAERGRDLEGVLQQYKRFVKPVRLFTEETVCHKKLMLFDDKIKGF
jgi:uridine kinase